MEGLKEKNLLKSSLCGSRIIIETEIPQGFERMVYAYGKFST